eukprot:3750124-Prymnesium_polylepis.1
MPVEVERALRQTERARQKLERQVTRPQMRAFAYEPLGDDEADVEAGGDGGRSRRQSSLAGLVGAFRPATRSESRLEHQQSEPQA